MKIMHFLLLTLALSACGRQETPVTVLSCANPVQGCSVESDGQTLHIRFSETPKPLRPFELKVTAEASSIEASFQMRDMEMGLNRYRLSAKANQWRANIILPACIRGRSDWQLQLDMETAAGISRYSLPFTSE